MIVRPRTADDVAACVSLALEVHRTDGYPGHLPADVTSFVAPPYERVAWVAEQHGRVVGHVALHEAQGDPTFGPAHRATGLGADRLAVLARLFVSPATRRDGVGARLVDTATRHADAEGRRVVLDVVQGFTGAVAFYEALGWVRLEPLELDLGTTVLDLWVYLSPTSGGPAGRPG
ncbi:GNAT family N-acetyltransferase [Kineosporia sp. A_224]|uniref:GNAT family N-acetyltransferase n=1 Tax=Kineosporia sp. A_224 TaxID=1962180 RepID=UPI000B4AEDF6|nr:GNAT family N-acetyltransferase [Kineosporia sp. A_224]